MEQAVQFYRDFQGFTGGHLKVFHYFQHVQASGRYIPYVRFTPDSLRDASNPWHASAACDTIGELSEPDIRFVAGLDWLALDSSPRHSAKPILNLIQHPRHAFSWDSRNRFLTNRAIRICVGEETKQALVDCGKVNGPIFVIPNAVDLAEIDGVAKPERRELDFLVVANKQPRLGGLLANALREAISERTGLHVSQTPRRQFLELLARAAVTIFLPDVYEGFYLPALEGMAIGTLVVCPDCVGNRSFCLPGQNCLRPEYTLEALRQAAEDLFRFDAAAKQQMRARARATAGSHTLDRERQTFLELLHEVDRLW